MQNNPPVHRLTAFSQSPEGGNPAGVVLADGPLDPVWMQSVAADVGYSETAFAWPATGQNHWTIRYFSPVAEVPFCGHATIATGAHLARLRGPGRHTLHTQAGEVAVDVSIRDGLGRAALTSVDPAVLSLAHDLRRAILETFGWAEGDLDPALPVALAYGGANHVLIALRSREALAAMAYDVETLRDIMLAHDLTTVAALWQESAALWHARNAFPVGGVVEDPATGAAAAALGGWLRESGAIRAPLDLVIHQGDDMGRPSRIDVHIPKTGGIVVAGNAVSIMD